MPPRFDWNVAIRIPACAAVRWMAEQSPGQEVVVSSDFDFRNGTVAAYCAAQNADVYEKQGKRLVYVPRKEIDRLINTALVGVHHMEGHLFAPSLEHRDAVPPFTALLVSGGHTLLIEMRDHGSYRLLGQTIDDAAGEAFDKVARLLGLPMVSPQPPSALACFESQARPPLMRGPSSKESV